MDTSVPCSEQCHFRPDQIVEFSFDAVGVAACHDVGSLREEYRDLGRALDKRKTLDGVLLLKRGLLDTSPHNVPILCIQLMQVQVVLGVSRVPHMTQLCEAGPKRSREPGTGQAMKEDAIGDDAGSQT